MKITRTIVATLALVLSCVTTAAQGQTVEWIRQFGSNERDESHGVSIDAFGNIYTTGYTKGDLDGTGVGTYAGGWDVFLRKYNSSGVLAWTTQLGTNADDFGNGVATDALGNVYITGSTNGDIDGAGPGTLTGDSDVLLSKYDGNGMLAWTRQVGSVDSETGRDVATDALGNVYVTGSTNGDIDGAGPETYGGSQDAFITKFDSGGMLLWTRQLGATSQDEGDGVATDALGNVYFSGFTSGDIDGAGPGTNAGRFDAVVGKYDGNGVLAWTRQFGGGDTDSSHALSTDLFGNVFVGGNTYGSIFGGGLGGSDRTVDSFISKYDSDGTLAWVRQFGVSGNDGVTAVSTDALGNVFVAGGTFGDIDGAGPGRYAGGGDGYVRKYDSSGTLAWTRQFGTSGLDRFYGMSTDALGNIYIAGMTSGDIDGAGAGTNAGGADAFLIKIHDDEFVPPVPEPATAGLMLIGILGLLGVRRRSSRLGS